jgi:quercetin dioxygenase-like cupin family protein
MGNIVDRFNALDQSLERIRHLSDAVAFKTLVVPNVDPTAANIKFEKGECKIEGVATCEHYSIMEATTSAEAVMQTHIHDQTEIIVVLEGDITIEFDNEQFTLGQYDTIVVHKGRPHRCSYVLPGKTLAILIPSEGTIKDERH